jgi:hypothetical protein
MLGFPVPYQDELIYSLVARAGVHSGSISPKQLLDDVYANRKIIATVDLSSHLTEISNQYPLSLNITVSSLIYQHTLFPIYAPFIDEIKRQAAMNWMASQSKGLIHLTLGVASSLIKQPKLLRYCPKCFEEQLAQKGERYWQRIWQVPGATWCCKHSIPLYEFAIQPHHEHRHEFHAADCTPDDEQLQSPRRESLRISNIVEQLLLVKPQKSPNAFQWSCYYRDLVALAGCVRGTKVKHDEVKERIYSMWSTDWLSDIRLSLTDRDTCWARTILRKHRKSFSFIQHIIIQSSLLDKDVTPSEVLTNVKLYPQTQRIIQSVILPKQINKDKRANWLMLLKEYGCKQARLLHLAQSLYMWLYRNDYDWLMRVNKRYQRPIVYEDKRVDWRKRDRLLVRRLSHLLNEYEKDDFSPRLSSTFFLSKLNIGAMPARKFKKLPLTKRFLTKYSESVAEYQIRRLSNEYVSLYLQHIKIERWRLLRGSGLSEQRLTPLSQCFLTGITEGIWATTDLNTSHKMR